ncbi:hypothetical protein [Desulfomonile tiedjei]|uniref:Uncharacterized protein n=1 Tax=Desulfomonile tiedjei (strain ATCC 49306 / DSM 6799 / DCB-1) TaxID=706587 RepID=I4C3Q2_DESTA|nr:hypothetical protein [Desulfomonile tiedjei]AFM24193.1 hypothetical protein Desti_1481 [Desulfomonile tiedjei DSM 6799]
MPVGRSYILCPTCNSRINIFKGVRIGSVIRNLVGLRFLADKDGLNDRFCEPGESWRVVNIVEPCPDRGKGRACESENHGRCPNQRLVVRLRRDNIVYKTCLYRRGVRIFDRESRTPVGNTGVSTGFKLPSDEK